MDIAEREDTLLSLMRQARATGQGGRPEDVACYTGFSHQKVMQILDELLKAGEVIDQRDGSFSLSGTGFHAAESIMRKHHVLEAFLQEMLGMDHEIAHAQACSMEHHASDDTINRLRKFLKGSSDCPAVCGRHHNRCSLKSLADCSQGEEVRIDAVRGCGRGGRLADLGLIPGERVLVKQRMADTLLIKVKDCDIAISPEIARSVLVEVNP
jgi:DtxR family transcriptional regulator, Mn-dependent transcriptional regulator